MLLCLFVSSASSAPKLVLEQRDGAEAEGWDMCMRMGCHAAACNM